MYKYEMDPTWTVGATEWTRDEGRTDRQTDRWSETNIPLPNNFAVGGVWKQQLKVQVYWIGYAVEQSVQIWFQISPL